MAETNIKILKIEVDTGTGELKVNGVTSSIKQATAATREFANSSKALGKELDKNRNKTGLASAVVVELGRTVSDSNYGMVAMANNLSQLSTLFTTLIATSDGLAAGLKSIWKAMMGPVGIILAFQVVIKYVEKAAMAARNLTSEYDKLRESQEKLASSTRAYVDELLEANRTEAEREAIFERISVKSGELADIIKENENNLSDLNDEIERYIEIQALRAMLDNEISNAVKNTAEFEKRLSVLRSNNIEEMKDMLNADGVLPNFIRFLGYSEEEIRQQFKQSMDSLFNIGERAEVRIEDLIKRLAELRSARKEDDKGSSKRLRNFKKHLLDLEKEEQAYRQKSLENQYINSQQKLDQEERFEEQDLLLKKFAFIQKERIRLENYLNQQKDSAKRKEAQLIFNQEVEAAEIEHQEALTQLRRSYANKRREDEIEDRSKSISDFAKFVNQSTKMQSDFFVSSQVREKKRAEERAAQQERENQIELRALEQRKRELEAEGRSTLAVVQQIANLRLKITQDRVKSELEIEAAGARDLADQLDKAKVYVSAAADLIDSEFQRSLDIEQNKTTALNNELRKRLQNEKLSADEKERINNQIAGNDEKLRVVQEKIARKRFKIDKAFKISMAVVDTASAALKAYASQLMIPSPDAPIRAGIAAAAATALGLAQVAMIARTQFVSSASSASGLGGAGGGAGGGGTQAPDFNIVGASPSNQLAAAVQGQFQQPVKAYVVSKDVTTAQEMDRNIIGSASLG